MEIEVGEYVKTDKGVIGKVTKIEYEGNGVRYAGEFITDTIIEISDNRVYDRRIKIKNIVKHSKNIIDLIEVGDYVNGKLIHKADIRKNSAYIYYGNGKTFVDYQMKSIVTKEQLSSVEYIVEEV